MKIAILSSFTPSLFWFRSDMMKAFLSEGHEVIAYGDEPEEKWQERFSQIGKGVKYRQIKVSRNGMNPLKDIATFFSIRKALKKEKPDKIFCYQAKTVTYGCIAAFTLGIREVYPLIAGLGSCFLAKGLKAFIVRTIMIIEYKTALINSRKVFFQNKDDSGSFIKHRIIKEKKIVYINGSGVNTQRFAVTPLPETPAFLNISRLIRDKGISEYLEACRIVKAYNPEYRCLLVGPFDTNPTALTKEQLEEYIRDGTIEYFGEQDDVRGFIEKASVFVLPSYHEGTPKSVLEAMSCGRAIITTDAPGCRETVTDGINGFLVKPKDINGLAEKMIFLAEHPETVAKMGTEARRVAEEKYDSKKVNGIILNTMHIKEKEKNVCRN